MLRTSEIFTYPVNTSDDTVGLIRCIENPLSKMEKHLQTYQKQMEDYQNELAAYQQEYDKPFPYREELIALKLEQQELNIALCLDNNEEVIVADQGEESETPAVCELEEEMEID